MANAFVNIEMTVDGKPIDALQRLIAQRIKYTNESAKQSLAACAIQILISLRAATTVAKVRNVEVTSEAQLYPSYFKNGATSIPCIRLRGSNTRQMINSHYLIWANNGTKLQLCQVYSFIEDRGENSHKYFIVAPDAKVAKSTAKNIIRKRIDRHKSLAKVALGTLMNKVAQTSKANVDTATQDTKKIANELSRATSTGYGSGDSGKYSLKCEDNLDYAMLALKGEQAAFDMACQKAANKIASVIKQKTGNNFFAPPVDIPFPEIRSK